MSTIQMIINGMKPDEIAGRVGKSNSIRDPSLNATYQYEQQKEEAEEFCCDSARAL